MRTLNYALIGIAVFYAVRELSKRNKGINHTLALLKKEANSQLATLQDFTTKIRHDYRQTYELY